MGGGTDYTEVDGGVSGGGGVGDDGNPHMRVSMEGRMSKGVDLTLDGKEGLFQVTGGVVPSYLRGT